MCLFCSSSSSMMVSLRLSNVCSCAHNAISQVTQELENQYEHRLAIELDRYDHLSEQVEASQQR